MINRDFKYSKKCRKISSVLVLFAILYLTFFQEVIGAAVILAFAIYFAFQYKCPHCHKTIDTRRAPCSTKYCPYCGEKLEK